jgi:hypothetical protein
MHDDIYFMIHHSDIRRSPLWGWPRYPPPHIPAATFGEGAALRAWKGRRKLAPVVCVLVVTANLHGVRPHGTRGLLGVGEGPGREKGCLDGGEGGHVHS